MSNLVTIRGKYYLNPIHEVPSSYLKWCLTNCKGMSVGMEQRIFDELDKRGEQYYAIK